MTRRQDKYLLEAVSVLRFSVYNQDPESKLLADSLLATQLGELVLNDSPSSQGARSCTSSLSHRGAAWPWRGPLAHWPTMG